MKRNNTSKFNILITARHSYVGNSLAGWLSNWPDRYNVDFVSQRDESWKAYDFSKVDVVVDVTGIAHVDIDEKDKKAAELYHRVNCELAGQTARAALDAGVKQFIYMSSMIVYGAGSLNVSYIDGETIPLPDNFYGRSKLDAEETLRKLVGDKNINDTRACVKISGEENMRLALIRSPMVYGPGSKGNYPKLSKLASLTPVFPATKNFRSMIYIEHLCELIRRVIEHGDEGIFCPQNRMPVNTGDMVKLMSHANNRPLALLPGFTKLIPGVYGKLKAAGRKGLGAAAKISAYMEKLFGDYAYTLELSNIYDGAYQLYPFSRTIWKTQKDDDRRIKYTGARKDADILPLVSIITVAFNSERTVSDTIESVLNQTYTNIDYWIIDGASTDDTVKIAESYRDSFEKAGISYHIVSEKDNGIYDAMNKGIEKSTGDIVGIINSDDWYEPNAVERMVDTYRETHFDMFYADLRIVKELANGRFDEMMIKRSAIREPIVSRDWNHPTTFITRPVYDRFKYKQESIHDDWDLVLKIRKNGYKVVILNEVLANFRYGGISNQKSLKKAFERGRARYRIYRNNGFSRFYVFDCILIELLKFI